MHTLTKADLTSTLTTLYSLSKQDAQSLVEHFFSVVTERLTAEEPVKLSGFGRFVLHRKRKRLARNPKTGEPAWVSQRTVVSFLPSVTLKEKFEVLAKLSQHHYVADQAPAAQAQNTAYADTEE